MLEISERFRPVVAAPAVAFVAVRHPELGVGYELGEVSGPGCAWMLAQGDADDVVPPEAVLSWARRPRRRHRASQPAGCCR